MKTTIEEQNIKLSFWDDGVNHCIQFQNYPDEFRLRKIGKIQGIKIESVIGPEFNPEWYKKEHDVMLTPGDSKDFDTDTIKIPKKKIKNIFEFVKELIELLKLSNKTTMRNYYLQNLEKHLKGIMSDAEALSGDIIDPLEYKKIKAFAGYVENIIKKECEK